jgi:hypothetical protein
MSGAEQLVDQSNHLLVIRIQGRDAHAPLVTPDQQVGGRAIDWL